MKKKATERSSPLMSQHPMTPPVFLPLRLGRGSGRAGGRHSRLGEKKRRNADRGGNLKGGIYMSINSEFEKIFSYPFFEF